MKKPILNFLKAFLYVTIFCISTNCYAKSMSVDTIIMEINHDYSLIVNRVSSNEFYINFKLNNIKFEKYDTQANSFIPKIENFAQSNIAELPSLPQKIISLEIPCKNKCDIQITDSNFSYYSYKLSGAIPPSPMSTETFNESIIKPYNGYLDNSLFSYSDIQTYRFKHYHYFNISPLNYDYNNERVKVCTEFKATIKYNESDVDNTFDLKSEKFKNSTLKNNLALADEAIPMFFSKDITEDYLIICLSWIGLEDINRFAEWKRTQGFRTHIEHRNRWTSEEVDSIVKSYYFNEEMNLTHLLIFSTHDNIPGMLVPSDGVYIDEIDPFPRYSDLRYACMDGPNDIIADIFYSRMPVYTSQQCKEVVDKWIKYQKTPIPDNDFYNKSFVSSCYISGTNNKEVAFEKSPLTLECEDIRTYLMKQSKSVERIYYADSDINPTYWHISDKLTIMGNDTIYHPKQEPIPTELKRPDFSWNGCAKDISKAINDGVFLGIYNGHGIPSAWKGVNYQYDDIIAQTNGNKQPFIISNACLTGDFTYFNAISNTLPRQKNGAITVFASSTVQYSPYSNFFLDGAIEYIFPNPGLITRPISKYNKYPENICTFGEMFQNGIRRMNFTDDDYLKYSIYGLHIYGDASSQFFSETPITFNSPNISSKADGVHVKLDLMDYPAIISFQDNASGHIEKYLSNISDCCFSYKSDSTVTVCIMGKNKIPYITTVDKFAPPVIITKPAVIEQVIYDKSKSDFIVSLNLECTDEDYCKNLLVTVSPIDEIISTIGEIDHATHTATIHYPNINPGIYVITVKDYNTLLGQYKLQVN